MRSNLANCGLCCAGTRTSAAAAGDDMAVVAFFWVVPVMAIEILKFIDQMAGCDFKCYGTILRLV